MKAPDKKDHVYHLTHNYKSSLSGENLKSLGIFSSLKKAKEAQRHARKQLGFSKYPRGFEIGTYVIDQMAWEEGFVTMKWKEK